MSCFATLGVPSNASTDQIMRAFEQLSGTLDPIGQIELIEARDHALALAAGHVGIAHQAPTPTQIEVLVKYPSYRAPPMSRGDKILLTGTVWAFMIILAASVLFSAFAIFM
jgi:hypothetical protein